MKKIGGKFVREKKYNMRNISDTMRLRKVRKNINFFLEKKMKLIC